VARGKTRQVRWLSIAVLVLIGAPVVLLVTKPRWLVSYATQYVESQRRESRPLVVVRGGEWRGVADGLELRKLRARRKGDWFSGFNVMALRVDPARVSLRVLKMGSQSLPVMDMVTLAEQTGALGLMNASYFEPDMKVMGLLINDGEPLSPLRKGGSIHHGVFLLRGARPFLLHRTDAELAGVDQAFQAGPWLVTDGKAHGSFRNAGVVTRRSALGLDRNDRVMLVATDVWLGGLSLPELAQLMAAPEPDGFGAWRAINCDGGTSTQMLLRHTRRNFTIRSSVHVPVYIGVFPRPSGT